MPTITIYVSGEILSILINVIDGNIKYEYHDENAIRKVSLKKTRKYPLEIQIPITMLSQFFPKDGYATIHLARTSNN